MLTVNEVAKVLNVHPVTIRRYIKEKKISHIKMGKSVRFTQKHIDTFIENFTIEAKKISNGGENA